MLETRRMDSLHVATFIGDETQNGVERLKTKVHEEEAATEGR